MSKILALLLKKYGFKLFLTDATAQMDVVVITLSRELSKLQPVRATRGSLYSCRAIISYFSFVNECSFSG